MCHFFQPDQSSAGQSRLRSRFKKRGLSSQTGK